MLKRALCISALICSVSQLYAEEINIEANIDSSSEEAWELVPLSDQAPFSPECRYRVRTTAYGDGTFALNSFIVTDNEVRVYVNTPGGYNNPAFITPDDKTAVCSDATDPIYKYPDGSVCNHPVSTIRNLKQLKKDLKLGLGTPESNLDLEKMIKKVEDDFKQCTEVECNQLGTVVSIEKLCSEEN
ncbi:hypothetical protein EOPP23_08125 [Endozoicomonas sp. OPT23]|uniref:hypothetical protein n=1 Tax=Endozoicomonas sp. OPT23 TaxID=2072845 RepID=UPI00129A3E43|nr:hypothetical protein [Endozoicomonas sp. OPT23]MRI32950.1 hypothetical protein [Endozoicomonas sp. OPT23]